MWSLGIGVWWSTAASLISSLLSKLKARSTYFENQTCTKATLKEIDSAGLLEKASIITTPTAYSDGFINSVKPEQTLGSELVTNGDFATDLSGWVLQNVDASNTITWEPNGARVISTSVNISLRQLNILTVGKTYKLTCDLAITTGRLALDGSTAGSTIQMVEGFNEITFTASSTNFIVKRYTGNDNCLIDNISVKEATNADFTFTRNSIGTRVNASGNVESVGVDLPRINYEGGCGSWLLEPGATNTATDSNDFTTGDIFVSSGNPTLLNSLTLTANATTSPDGLINALKIQIGSTSTAINRIRYTSVVVVSGNINTLSIFAKKGSGVDWFGIFVDGIDDTSRVWFDLENGVLGTSSSAVVNQGIEDYGNGWYRCSMSFTTSVDTSATVSFVITDVNGGGPYSGDLTDHHFIYGLQAESHATRDYATSYIPTSGSTVTRGADLATNAGSSDLINDSEGVLYTEIAALSDSLSHRRISLSDGTINNLVYISFDTNSNRILANANGKILTHTVSDETEFHKVAVLYNSTAPKLFVNGVLVETETAMNAITGLNQVRFDGGVGNNAFRGKVKCVAVYKEALTDAELTALTS